MGAGGASPRHGMRGYEGAGMKLAKFSRGKTERNPATEECNEA